MSGIGDALGSMFENFGSTISGSTAGTSASQTGANFAKVFKKKPNAASDIPSTFEGSNPTASPNAGADIPQYRDADMKEPNGQAHWTLREEDNFILAKNQRTGELEKVKTVPLSKDEKKQALAKHGAGSLDPNDPNRQHSQMSDGDLQPADAAASLPAPPMPRDALAQGNAVDSLALQAQAKAEGTDPMFAVPPGSVQIGSGRIVYDKDGKPIRDEWTGPSQHPHKDNKEKKHKDKGNDLGDEVSEPVDYRGMPASREQQQLGAIPAAPQNSPPEDAMRAAFAKIDEAKAHHANVKNAEAVAYQQAMEDAKGMILKPKQLGSWQGNMDDKENAYMTSPNGDRYMISPGSSRALSVLDRNTSPTQQMPAAQPPPPPQQAATQQYQDADLGGLQIPGLNPGYGLTAGQGSLTGASGTKAMWQAPASGSSGGSKGGPSQQFADLDIGSNIMKELQSKKQSDLSQKIMSELEKKFGRK